MRTSSGLAAIVVPRSLRIRPGRFLVRMWFLCECLRLTLPVLVKRKRFLDPLWDFILGIVNLDVAAELGSSGAGCLH